MEVENDNTEIIGGGMSIDIVIPSIKLAIDFRGKYWHSNDFAFRKTYENLDSEAFISYKERLCQEKGYDLISIYEDRWNENEDMEAGRLRKILVESYQIG